MGSGGPGPGPTPARRTRNASTLHATTFPSPVHARRLLICASTAFGLVMRVATTATGTPFVTGEDAIACRLGCRACKTHRLASLANLAPVRPVPLTVQAISRGSKFTNPFVFDKGLGCDGKIGAGSYACTSCPSGKFSAAGASECTGPRAVKPASICLIKAPLSARAAKPASICLIKARPHPRRASLALRARTQVQARPHAPPALRGSAGRVSSAGAAECRPPEKEMDDKSPGKRGERRERRG